MVLLKRRFAGALICLGLALFGPGCESPTDEPATPGTTVEQLIDAWAAQDWAEMARFVDADGLEVAKAASRPEHRGPLHLRAEDAEDPERGSRLTIDAQLDCAVSATECEPGLWFCHPDGSQCVGEILYALEPEAPCCALIYALTVDAHEGGWRVSGIDAAGDAG